MYIVHKDSALAAKDQLCVVKQRIDQERTGTDRNGQEQRVADSEVMYS